MPTRKTSQPPPIEPKVFTSIEKVERGITKLRQCITDLERLDPEKVHYGDQRIQNVASDIQDTIFEVL